VVVGIGASAGGLEALQSLVKGLSAGQRLTYVIAQHLSPSHESMMVELIRRDSRLPVADASDGIAPLVNHIYITPPNRDVEIRDGLIRLSEARTGPMPKPDINRFFRSIARDCGQHSVGIILSGTGTDGAIGMLEIRTAGGITLAEDPSTAKYDGMPMSAIHADAVDLVQTPQKMAETLAELDQNRISIGEIGSLASDETYFDILDLVHKSTGVDLNHYKRSSIQRRIRRRMSICNRLTLTDYLELLRSDGNEVQALARDAFVGVTGFFRDPEVFRELAVILEDLFDRLGENDELRVWAAGCASGEEAYTLAILIEEYLQQARRMHEYRVFATDIGAEPLARARLGHYSADSVASVAPAVLARYFRETGSGYTLIRRLRDHVVFSNHDLIRDAPFSKIDLVSCRNVMIYFDNELQRQVFDTFHYALKPNGLLLLGTSETNAQAEKLFGPVSGKHRIYRKLEAPGHRSRLPQILPGSYRDKVGTQPSRPTLLEAIDDRLNRLLAASFGPPAAVVNQQNEIMFTLGDCSDLMSVKSGPASLDILTLVKDTIRSTLRAVLYRVRRESVMSVDYVARVVVPEEPDTSRRVLVMPFDPNRPGWLLIVFEPSKRLNAEVLNALSHDDASDSQTMLALEQELFSTRESLQTVVEELETTNEELQAANEELQSSNEEFQSTNEELQTTNEELQSSNEELLTLNDELQAKTREYERLANQLQNIQNSVDTPLLVVDNDLRVTRHAPATRALIDLDLMRDQDHISALPWRHEIDGLRETVSRVIDSHQVHRSILRLGLQVWQMHITPFIEDENRVNGAVLVFSDSTELYVSREQYRQEQERAQITLESIGDGVIRVDVTGLIEYINPVGSAMLGWPLDECEGHPLDKIFVISTRSSDSMGSLAQKLLTSGTPETLREGDCLLTSRSGKQLHVNYTITATTDDHGHPNGAVLTFRDMTDQQETLSRMSWMSSHDDLTGAVNRREMEKRLATTLNAINQGRHREAVFLYLDLDQFKVVNDTCGHLAGDELLKNITRILRQHTRHRDTLGRLGGDEFGVLLEGCVIGEAEMVAEKIRLAIEQYRFRWKDKVFRVGISIGVVGLTPESGHISDVLANADAACYAAKGRGRNRIHIHTPDDEELNQQRADLHWVSEINDAMENDRLRLFMHEIRSCHNDDAPHWEALLRMFNRKGKLLLPGSFLPAAERYGLIQRLDEWVIDSLFSTLHEYRPAGEGRSHPRVNVNLSGASFTDARITDHVHACLEKYDIDPSRIAFEITETAAISNLGTAQGFIERIKRLGCRVALDDFGSGMSSLSYLKKLDVDFLKIDGSFIQDIESDPLSRTIVSAIVEIARQLDIETIAEFASTDGIVEELRKLGVGCVQGEAVSDPIPLEAFLDCT
jgi:two-component system, chemotaxis family, CheB/CheR fusion protein